MAEMLSDHNQKTIDSFRSSQTTFLDNGSAGKNVLAADLQEQLNADYFNADGSLPYNDPQIQHERAAYLSQRTATVVPTYNEQGTIADVVGHLIDLQEGHADNIIVTIAPPKKTAENPTGAYDASADRAREAGAKYVVYQTDIFHHGIRDDKLEKIGVTEDDIGKGFTCTTAEALLAFAPPPGVAELVDLDYINHHDSDIQNPYEFQVLAFLATVAMEHADEYLEIRAARGGRNNEPIHEAIKALHVWAKNYGQEVFRHKRNKEKWQVAATYGDHMYRHLSRIKWPLSGQVMESPEVVMNTLRPTGYGIEIGMNVSVADITENSALNPKKKRLAQVDITTPCIDAGNDPRKEQLVESLINRLLAEMVTISIERGKPIEAFTLADLKELNQRLKAHQVEYYTPAGAGPNTAMPIKQDAVLPSLRMMDRWGMIRHQDLRRYRDREFGRRHPGVSVKTRGVVHPNGNGQGQILFYSENPDHVAPNSNGHHSNGHHHPVEST